MQTGAIIAKFKKLDRTNFKWVGIFTIICFIFYWYQIRPSLIYKNCYTKSIEGAKHMMKERADRDPFNTDYKENVEKEWYLVDDYENFFKNCLRSKGIQK